MEIPYPSNPLNTATQSLWFTWVVPVQGAIHASNKDVLLEAGHATGERLQLDWLGLDLAILDEIDLALPSSYCNEILHVQQACE